jgi:MFS family permease
MTAPPNPESKPSPATPPRARSAVAENAGRATSPAWNMHVLTSRAMLYGLRESMVRAVWQPFVLSLGTSVPLLGLLESLGGFWGFVPTAILPLGGWISDRRGRKSLLLTGSTFGLAGLLVIVVAAWAGSCLG